MKSQEFLDLRKKDEVTAKMQEITEREAPYLYPSPMSRPSNQGEGSRYSMPDAWQTREANKKKLVAKRQT